MSTAEQLWTVARSPSGSWSTGGKPTDSCYSECEVWQVMAKGRVEATRKAQALRRKAAKAAHPEATPGQRAPFPIDPAYVIRHHTTFWATLERMKDPEMPDEHALRVSHNGFQSTTLTLDPIEARKIVDLLESFAAPKSTLNPEGHHAS